MISSLSDPRVLFVGNVLVRIRLEHNHTTTTDGLDSPICGAYVVVCDLVWGKHSYPVSTDSANSFISPEHDNPSANSAGPL